MGKFNSDNHYIYYCGQESLRRNGIALHSQQESQKCSTWLQSPNDRMISVCFPGKTFNIRVAQVYAPTTNAKETEVEWCYEDLQDLLEIIPKKDALSIIWYWNANVGSQEIPGVKASLALEYKMKQGKG